MRTTIQEITKDAFLNAYKSDIEILVDIPKNNQADYSVNTPLQSSRDLGKKPIDIANKIVDLINQDPRSKLFSKVESIHPGFIYFTVSDVELLKILDTDLKNWGQGNLYKDKKMMIEFACPNTHKAFHIGHFRNISLGESIVRLIANQGAETFRANYQGDIGPHTAKCTWALMQISDTEFNEVEKLDVVSKTNFIGKMYAKGAEAYESDEKAKEEIHAINRNLYLKTLDQKTKDRFDRSKQWSLDYFEYIYQRLNSHFDHYFFESEVWELGQKIVEENIGKIFEESKGAIIFKAEEINPKLHTRVFITKDNTPTYEAKDLGLSVKQRERFNYDKNIHVVGNEQREYFKVEFEAQYQVFPELRDKQEHLSYGMVTLKEGKMSSRTGKIITGEWLMDTAKESVIEILSERDLEEAAREEIAEKVAIGALKFGMLHVQAKNDFIFDMSQAVKLDGDSGPYLQYAHARICSIIQKIENDFPLDDKIEYETDDITLLRKTQYFPYVCERSARERSPHYLTHYLLGLTSDFSAWYAKQSVLKADNDDLKRMRIKLIKLIKSTIANGLDLLGIKAPEKM